MVEVVGFEPTQPGAADLQSAATLQLRRTSVKQDAFLLLYFMSGKQTDFH